MRRLLNVERLAQLFSEPKEAEGDVEPDSEPESEDFDDEMDDLDFVLKEESEEEEPPARAQSATRWSAQTKGRRGSPARSRSPLRSEPWKTMEDTDTAPGVSRFQPRRTPGVQAKRLSPQSPKDLFLLFFATDTVRTICSNTNKNAAESKDIWEKYTWTELEMIELYQFFGLLIYMSLVSLPSLRDYWRQNHIFSVALPAKVMTIHRFWSIFRNIHLSDPEEDEYKDKLFRVRPLYDDILRACQAYYHPGRELTVDERIEATTANTGMARYMKDKPAKSGMKLFVLAESSSGYTLRFSIHTGKPVTASEHGLPYDVVMDLIEPSWLGTGYHIYMDSFYTSPKLFRDLASMEFGACGTYKESRKGCPRGRANALTERCGRGSVRWIREGPLLFVKWMDTQEMSVCSTIHPAFSGKAVQRRVKKRDRRRTGRDIPCPTPVMAYNKNMGGVDPSDQLIQYHSTQRRTTPWYRTALLHFLDIATTNAFILHREMSTAKQVQSTEHRDFMVELVSQLCGTDTSGVPQSRRTHHVPVPIVTTSDASRKASKGRLKCKQCRQLDNRSDTPWKCQACNVPLCLVVGRNCFLEWHK